VQVHGVVHLEGELADLVARELNRDRLRAVVGRRDQPGLEPE
jgi:hypothetical protein